MSIMSEPKSEKKPKVLTPWMVNEVKLRSERESVLKTHSISANQFYPKSQYFATGSTAPQGNVVMEFFGWELDNIYKAKLKTIYTENVTNLCIPELPKDGNPVGTIYQLEVAQDWKECPKTVKDGKYMVPTKGLKVIHIPTTKQTKIEFNNKRDEWDLKDDESDIQVPKLKDAPLEKFDNIMNPDKDMPLDQITTTDYMAIDRWIPCSNKAWLNEIILKFPEGCH